MPDRQSAFHYLEKALKVAPLNGEVLFRAAIVYHRFNEPVQRFRMSEAADAGYSRAIIRDTPDFADLQEYPQSRSLEATT